MAAFKLGDRVTAKNSISLSHGSVPAGTNGVVINAWFDPELNKDVVHVQWEGRFGQTRTTEKVLAPVDTSTANLMTAQSVLGDLYTQVCKCAVADINRTEWNKHVGKALDHLDQAYTEIGIALMGDKP